MEVDCQVSGVRSRESFVIGRLPYPGDGVLLWRRAPARPTVGAPDGWRASPISIAKRAEKRAINPAISRGILKIVGSAVSADWAELPEAASHKERFLRRLSPMGCSRSRSSTCAWRVAHPARLAESRSFAIKNWKFPRPWCLSPSPNWKALRIARIVSR